MALGRTDLWTREEMILVLNLYLKLPFGKMDSRNPEVIRLAGIITFLPEWQIFLHFCIFAFLHLNYVRACYRSAKFKQVCLALA